MTKLTRDTALSEIFHQYIMPIMSKRIMHMVTRMMVAEMKSKVRRQVTANTETTEMPKLIQVSSHMVRYCS